MEEFVRRLFTDVDFRREFLSNPSQVIANCGLNHTEEDAVLRLSGQLTAVATAPRPGILRMGVLYWD